MSSDVCYIIGFASIAAGVLIIIVTQFILSRKMNRFNKEWEKNLDEMS